MLQAALPTVPWNLEHTIKFLQSVASKGAGKLQLESNLSIPKDLEQSHALIHRKPSS